MSILDYFSRDENKRAEFIFNFIAPLYAKADGVAQKSYHQSIDLLKNKIDIKGSSVLDLGSGTGAWAAMFLSSQAGRVEGIDLSQEMVNQSQKKHPAIKFSKGNSEKLTGIEENSFDVVTASFVLHGVTAERRMRILSEMNRVSKRYVVLHDFYGPAPMLVRLLEWLEKSDYKNFKKNIVDELKIVFSQVEVIPTGSGSALYLATK